MNRSTWLPELRSDGDTCAACPWYTTTTSTVGDPFKDTSGPAMNIVVEVMTMVVPILAPAFV